MPALLAAVLVAWMAGGGEAAQRQGKERTPSRETLRVAVRPGAAGEPNGNGTYLAEQDCQAKVGSREAKVRRVLTPADDLLILLVTDLSGNLGTVQPAKEAVAEEISKAGEKVWVGLLRCQDGLQVVLDPTNDHEQVRAALMNLTVAVTPGLLDTVEAALRLGDAILEKSAVRLAVLYVTDSNIYDYRADYVNPSINPSDQRDMSRRFPEALIKEKITQLTAKLRALAPPLFILHLDYRSDTLNQAYQTGLLQLATESGGAAHFCRSRAEIPEATRQVFAQILSLHGVELAAPAGSVGKATPLVISCGERDLRYRTVITHDGR